MQDRHDVESGEGLTGVQIVAARADRRIDEVSRAIHQVILRDVTELDGDQHLVDILHNSVAANVSTAVHALRYAIDAAHFEVPAVATEYARRLAQHNVPLEALIRAYRLGQTEFLRIAFDEARAVETNAAAALIVAQQIMDKTAEYIDWVTERVIRSYSVEHDRWLIQRNVVRSRHIRRLLEGRYPENNAPDAAIDFPLRMRHIAVIAWIDPACAEADALVQIEAELRRLRESLPMNGESLLVPADEATVWAWIPLLSHTTADEVTSAVDALSRQRARRISYALGTIESGGHGFRVSHVRAQLVRNMMLGAQTGNRVAAFSDPAVSVAALFGRDLELAKDWVSSLLGSLARDDPDTARLRETLAVFLMTGSTYKTAANRLHIHPNTVKYRVHKAEEKLQLPSSGGRIDVALALILCAQLGSAVLAHD
jgi:DNA-binding PucR family transcriptional regulator